MEEKGVWGNRGDAQMYENDVIAPEKKSRNFQVTIYSDNEKNV